MQNKFIRRTLVLLLLTVPVFLLNIKMGASTLNIPDSNFKRCLNIALKVSDTSADITVDQMKSLNSIVCNNMSIKSITGIEYATNVTTVSLYKNEISDLTPLSNLSKITSLTLHNNKITDITPLKNLTNLRLLHIEKNQVKDVSSLKNLTNLRYLYLGNNNISDISSLNNLSRLYELFLQNNSITDISVLSNMPLMKWLSIDNNNVKDISSVKRMYDLLGFYASGNEIVDISPLSGLLELNELYLNGNHIDNTTALRSVNKMYALGVINQTIYRGAVYEMEELNNYAPLQDNVKLPNGSNLQVTQYYNATTRTYIGSYSQTIKGVGPYSGKVTTPILRSDQTADANIYGTPFSVDEKYAPKSSSELSASLNFKAIDGSTGQNITSKLVIENIDGYNYNLPKPGQYAILVSAIGESGNKVYFDEIITVVAAQQSNDFAFSDEIISDEDGDLKVSPGEQVLYQVEITNQNNVDIENPTITYKVNNNYLNLETISNIDTGGVRFTLEGGIITLYPERLSLNQTITISYNVSANAKWYMNKEVSLLDNFTNELGISFGIESYNFTSKTDLPEAAFKSVDAIVTITDESENNLLSTSEDMVFKYQVENESLYYIKKYTISIAEESTHLKHDFTDFTITSNKRTMVLGVDYKIVNGVTLEIYEYEPSEKLGFSFNEVAKAKFATANDLVVKSLQKIYDSSQKTVLHVDTDTTTMPVDADLIYSTNITATTTDRDDENLEAGEQFVIEFRIENNGSLDANNIKLKLNLDDVNIVDTTLLNSNVNIAVEAKDGTRVLKSNLTYDVSGNTITLDKVEAGSTAYGEIILTATNQLDVTAFTSDLLNAKISDTLQYSDSAKNISIPITMPLDYQSATNLKTEITSLEVIGDGDNLVDVNETFEYKITLTNQGLINLPNLSLDTLLNTNNAIDILTQDLQVLDQNGAKITDYKITESNILFSDLKPGDQIVVTITVNYGASINQAKTLNSFPIVHPYLKDQTLSSNLNLDSTNQNITINASQNQNSISQNSEVEYEVVIKNEGLTVEKDFTLSYLYDANNIDVSSITNIVINNGQLLEGTDYTIDRNTITFKEIKPAEELVVKFSVKTKNSFNVTSDLGADYIIKNKFELKLQNNKVLESPLNLTPQFGIIDYDLETSLTSLDGTTLALTDSVLVAKIDLTNGQSVNSTNNTITIDLTDADIKEVLEMTVTSASGILDYKVVNNQMIIKNIPVNEKISIELTLQTKATFDSSSFINLPLSVSSDFGQVETELVIEKNLSALTKVTTSSKLISTSSGDMQVDANENLNYELKITNKGSVNLNDITVSTNLSSPNLDSQSLISITDQNGTDLSSNTSYLDDKLTIDSLSAGQEITILYQVSTPSSIEFDSNFKLTNQILGTNVSLTNNLPLSINLSGVTTLNVEVNREIISGEESLGAGDGFKTTITITNEDGIAVNDVDVSNLTNDINVDDNYTNLTVKDQDGNDLVLNSDYLIDNKTILVSTVAGNSEVIITYTNSLKETLENEPFADFIVSITADYPGIGEKQLIDEAQIPIATEQEIEYDFVIDSTNQNGNSLVKPGDTIDLQITFNNTGNVNLTNINLVPKISQNLDYTSLQVINSDQASVTNGAINIYSAPSKETVVINLTVKTKAVFGPQTTLLIEYSSNISDVKHVDSETLQIDRSSALIDSTLSLSEKIGDEDGKVDGNEIVTATLTLENKSKFTIENVSILNTILDSNIKDITNFAPLTTDADGNMIISSFPANTSVTTTYDITINELLTSATEFTHERQITTGDGQNELVSSKLDIDILQSTSISTSLAVIDQSLNQAASANEILTYAYQVANNGTRTIEDFYVNLGLDNRNLNSNVNIVSYKLNGDDQAYNYDNLSHNFTIDNLNPDDNLEIVFEVNTTSTLGPNLITRIFNVAIDNTVTLKDASNTVNESATAKIAIDEEVVTLSSNAYIVDQDNNNALSANEQFSVFTEVTNTGQFVLTDISLDPRLLGSNYTRGYTLSIKDENGIEQIEGIDYTVNGDTVIISELQPNQKFILEATFTAKDQIELDSITTVKVIIKNKYIAAQNLIATIGNDSSQRNLAANLSLSEGDEIPIDPFGTNFYYSLILENIGTTIERDIELSRMVNTDNLKFIIQDYQLLIDGIDYSNEIISKDGTLIIPVLNPGQRLEVHYGAYLNQDLVDTNAPNLNLDIVSSGELKLNDGTTEEFSTTSEIEKVRIVDTSISATIKETQIEDTYANGLESLTSTINIKSLSNLIQKDVELEIEIDELNANPQSFEITKITDNQGTPLPSNSYTISDNIIKFAQMNYLDEYLVEYSYNVENNITVTPDMKITDKYYLRMNYMSEAVNQASIKINPDQSSLKVDTKIIDASGNNDGLAQTNEVLTLVSTLENTGNFIETNLIFENLMVDLNYDLSSVNNIIVSRDGNVLKSGEDYQVNIAERQIIIFELLPGETVEVRFDFETRDVLYDSEDIEGSSVITSQLSGDYNSAYDFPIDIAGESLTPITETFVDENNQVFENGETVTFTTSFVNDGSINYQNVKVELDFKAANFDYNTAVVTIIGPDKIEYVFDDDLQYYTFNISDFLIGESYTIEIKYNPTDIINKTELTVHSDYRAKTLYKTDSESLNTFLALENTDNEDADPQISGNDTATVIEGTLIDDTLLKELFEIKANDYGSRILTVIHQIDNTKAGDYVVTFELEDEMTHLKDKFTATLTVLDVVPTITGDKKQVIKIGSTDIDFTELFNLNAKELEDFDLNDNVIVDDSEVNYFKVGMYNIKFTVKDDEGNIVNFNAQLEITDGLANTGLGLNFLPLLIILVSLIVVRVYFSKPNLLKK